MEQINKNLKHCNQTRPKGKLCTAHFTAYNSVVRAMGPNTNFFKRVNQPNSTEDYNMLSYDWYARIN